MIGYRVNSNNDKDKKTEELLKRLNSIYNYFENEIKENCRKVLVAPIRLHSETHINGEYVFPKDEETLEYIRKARKMYIFRDMACESLELFKDITKELKENGKQFRRNS